MESNERIKIFLKLQSEGISFNDISNKIGISSSALRNYLNRRGYKSENGKYILKSQKTKEKNNLIKEDIDESKSKKQIKKNVKPKKDKKINLTEEDLDKLCEVYDWYLQVKDNKNMNPKKAKKKKDILIEEENLKQLKSISVKVDKNTWEEFERLCSNSTFNKQQIITQALKDFMKEYKNLL